MCLSIGSSLQVQPAMLFPLEVSRKGKLAIINLQPTPLDSNSEVRIWAKIDDAMKMLMNKL